MSEVMSMKGLDCTVEVLDELAHYGVSGMEHYKHKYGKWQPQAKYANGASDPKAKTVKKVPQSMAERRAIRKAEALKANTAKLKAKAKAEAQLEKARQANQAAREASKKVKLDSEAKRVNAFKAEQAAKQTKKEERQKKNVEAPKEESKKLSKKELKKAELAQLSDAELQKRINRINNEATYRKLTMTKREQFIESAKQMLVAAGRDAAQNALKKAANNAVNYALDAAIRKSGASGNSAVAQILNMGGKQSPQSQQKAKVETPKPKKETQKTEEKSAPKPQKETPKAEPKAEVPKPKKETQKTEEKSAPKPQQEASATKPTDAWSSSGSSYTYTNKSGSSKSSNPGANFRLMNMQGRIKETTTSSVMTSTASAVSRFSERYIGASSSKLSTSDKEALAREVRRMSAEYKLPENDDSPYAKKKSK